MSKRDNYDHSNLLRNVVPEQHRQLVERQKAAEEESRRQFEAWKLRDSDERSPDPLRGLWTIVDRSSGNDEPFGF